MVPEGEGMPQVLGPERQADDARIGHAGKGALGDVPLRHRPGEGAVADEEGRLKGLQACDAREVPGARGIQAEIGVATLDEDRDAVLEALLGSVPGAVERFDRHPAIRQRLHLLDEGVDGHLARLALAVGDREGEREGLAILGEDPSREQHRRRQDHDE